MFVWAAGMTERQNDAGKFRGIYPKGPPRSNLVPCSKRCILPIYERRQFFFFWLTIRVNFSRDEEEGPWFGCSHPC